MKAPSFEKHLSPLTLLDSLNTTDDQNRYRRTRDITFCYSTHSSSFSKPGAYITHHATEPLTAITGGSSSVYMQHPLEPPETLDYVYHSSSMWSSPALLYFVSTHSFTGSYKCDLLPVRCISSIVAPLHWCRTRSSHGRLASCSPPPGSGPTAGRPVSSNTTHNDFTAKSHTQTSYIGCYSCCWVPATD